MLRNIIIDTQEDTCRELVMRLNERNRWLNRDAIEATEKLAKFINSIGGFDVLERLRQEEKEFKLLQPLIAATQEYNRVVQSQGPLFSDLMSLLDSEDDSVERRWRKINRFVFYFGPKLSDPKANESLKERARESKTKAGTLLEQVYFPSALADVLARKNVRQAIRLGTKWVKSHGRVKPKRPSDLFWYQFFLWIRKEVYNETEKRLLDKASNEDATQKSIDGAFFETEETWHSPKRSSIADEQTFRNHWRKEFFGSGEKDLDVLKASEQFPLRTLLRSNDYLTPREKELLKILVKNGLKTPARSISKKMRIAESTARVFKRNLLQKFPLFSAI